VQVLVKSSSVEANQASNRSLGRVCTSVTATFQKWEMV
jgi:hypothetical protein